MLSIRQISNRIDDLSAERESLFDFERWFRLSSRDVHLWGSDQLIDAVFSIEAVFSEYHFADMEEPVVKQELENAIRPFERLKHLRDTKVVAASLNEASGVQSNQAIVLRLRPEAA